MLEIEPTHTTQYAMEIFHVITIIFIYFIINYVFFTGVYW